jgi:hypothetical protein
MNPRRRGTDRRPRLTMQAVGLITYIFAWPDRVALAGGVRRAVPPTADQDRVDLELADVVSARWLERAHLAVAGERRAVVDLNVDQLRTAWREERLFRLRVECDANCLRFELRNALAQTAASRIIQPVVGGVVCLILALSTSLVWLNR